MKIKIFLLLLLLGNLFYCFGQNNKINAIKRALSTVSERIDELEKRGFKVRKTDVSSIYSPLKIGANFGQGETVYIEAMIITDEKDKFSINSEINVYCSQRDLSTKSGSKDSLLNKTLLTRSYKGKNNENINVWETLFIVPTENNSKIISYSAYVNGIKNRIHVVGEPATGNSLNWLEDVNVLIVYTKN